MNRNYKIAVAMATLGIFVLIVAGVYNLYQTKTQKPKTQANTSDQLGFTSLPSLPPTARVLGQQPETGPEFWQLATLAGLIPVGYTLSIYGKRKQDK